VDRNARRRHWLLCETIRQHRNFVEIARQAKAEAASLESRRDAGSLAKPLLALGVALEALE
jgi:hypothetical protein